MRRYAEKRAYQKAVRTPPVASVQGGIHIIYKGAHTHDSSISTFSGRTASAVGYGLAGECQHH
jgi:hypothetical protein